MRIKEYRRSSGAQVRAEGSLSAEGAGRAPVGLDLLVALGTGAQFIRPLGSEDRLGEDASILLDGTASHQNVGVQLGKAEH